jgi:hypothetical protein
MLFSRTFLSFCFRDVIGLPIKLRLVVCDMLFGEAHPATQHVRHDIRMSDGTETVIFCIIKSSVLMMNRLIDCRSETTRSRRGVHDHREHVNFSNKSLVLNFFINRFTDGNTSHGRIGYAGRILSKNIGSQDDVEEEKLSSCSIRAQNTKLPADCFVLLARCVAAADNSIVVASRHFDQQFQRPRVLLSLCSVSALTHNRLNRRLKARAAINRSAQSSRLFSGKLF